MNGRIVVIAAVCMSVPTLTFAQSSPQRSDYGTLPPVKRSTPETAAPMKRSWQPVSVASVLQNRAANTTAAAARLEPAAAPTAPRAVTAYLKLRGGVDLARTEVGGQSGNETGAVYGMSFGADVPISRRGFIGAFAGIDGSTTGSETMTILPRMDSTILEVTATEDQGRDIEIGLRGGMYVTETISVFAFGALSTLKLDLETTDVVVTPADPTDPTSEEIREDAFTTSFSEYLTGWRAGVGAEMAIRERIFGHTSYRYTDYGESDALLQSRTRHQLISGVGLRF